MKSLYHVFLSFFLPLFFIYSCVSYKGYNTKPFSHREDENSSFYVGQFFYGKAVYYHDKYHGRKTASGEYFSQSNLTAAHRTLPFGTIVKVTNLKNGLSVVVRINDRGPFGAKDKIIDLSKEAARRLNMLKDGVIPVKVEILRLPN